MQPQIVTFTLDLLLAQNVPIDQVCIVYLPSNPRYAQAAQRLASEFPGDRYAGRSCHLRKVPVKIASPPPGDPVGEVSTPGEVDAAWRTINDLLAELKAQEQHLHLSLSGGRRMLSLLAFSVAMLHFTPNDHAWHIYTPPEISQQAQEESWMHLQPDSGIRLVEVPLVPWGAYFPGMRDLLGLSPSQARDLQLNWLDRAEERRCQQVWDSLTGRQKEVLHALSQGQSRPQIAETLGVAISTIDTHKKDITQKCRQVWDLEQLDMRVLYQRFRVFLAHKR